MHSQLGFTTVPNFIIAQLWPQSPKIDSAPSSKWALWTVVSHIYLNQSVTLRLIYYYLMQGQYNNKKKEFSPRLTFQMHVKKSRDMLIVKVTDHKQSTMPPPPP